MVAAIPRVIKRSQGDGEGVLLYVLCKAFPFLRKLCFAAPIHLLATTAASPFISMVDWEPSEVTEA